MAELTREQIVTAIMGLLKPSETVKPRPSIEELERLLNSDDPPAIHLNPDGTVSEFGPRTTTVGEVADAILALSRTSSPPLRQDHVDIVFDDPPGHKGGRFVEVENAEGKSIRFGEWVHRQDGYWMLRIPASLSLAPEPILKGEVGEMVKRLTAGKTPDYDRTPFEAAAMLRRLSAAREAVLAEVAGIFLEKAAVHAKYAKWIGPERQRYEGARIAGVEMSPMNGPAIAYDAEMANVARIRALKSAAGSGEGETVSRPEPE